MSQGGLIETEHICQLTNFITNSQLGDEIEIYLLMAVLFSKYISFNHIVAFNQLYSNITICILP